MISERKFIVNSDNEGVSILHSVWPISSEEMQVNFSPTINIDWVLGTFFLNLRYVSTELSNNENHNRDFDWYVTAK
jgi:hypothetical protein